MKVTKRQLRRLIREEKAKLPRRRVLKEALTHPEVIDEIEDINEITGKLLSALETGGIETPDMNGLTFEQHEILRRAMEDLRYTVAELLTQLTEA